MDRENLLFCVSYLEFIPDVGEVHAAGDISLLAGLGTGFSGHQTGRENALLYGSILGHNEDEMREKLDEIIEFSELGDFIDEPLRTYSAGMKARLGLAVASAYSSAHLTHRRSAWSGRSKFQREIKSKNSLYGKRSEYRCYCLTQFWALDRHLRPCHFTPSWRSNARWSSSGIHQKVLRDCG